MSSPIIVEQKVEASVDEVWEALTDKEKMKSWYFDISDFELEPEKQFNFYEPGDEKKYHHHGHILDFRINEKLKHTWSYPGFSDAETIVTWELHPKEGGTVIKLTHEYVDRFKDLGEGFSEENFTEGWNVIIRQSLKSYVENK
ncbi:SRPBCC family protein [Chryseobacterium paridis]|uniref:SRPBCC domain-containing protein n=1 Tax=Chryseobacterium paridis TaxID=2800328 RepID=A0ABS1FXL1_9FLAO|nr:SRPBCC domain-containing protein [Chryseobacterium paridis]MBK1897150.1 SRPBCC domain-containing protein [Chryseobacterium paridis]